MDEILKKYVPGFVCLNEDVKQAIFCFTLLWTVFEGQVLEKNAFAAKIKKKTREWEEAGELKDQQFKDTLDYFTDRYIDEQTRDPNENFTSLNLRNNDDKPLVISVLKKKKSQPSDKLAACLIIIYRIRNNFFHGGKWEDEMAEQKDNFNHSSKLMGNCIKRFQRI